ncbi:MAG: hypothetical protein ACRD9R_14255 [Pyrinomonadaceae bacterium]
MAEEQPNNAGEAGSEEPAPVSDPIVVSGGQAGTMATRRGGSEAPASASDPIVVSGGEAGGGN